MTHIVAMKEYDPLKPLISIHIPKCAGGSIRRLLKEWFGENLYRHYFQQLNGPPPKHPLAPGICIHGHFNRAKGFGVMDYYPEADQFITILRDPLEIAISNYFFWKRTGRANQIRRGTLRPGDEHDYRDVTDFFRKRPRSHILRFMPYEVTMDNYQDLFETHFVHVGVVEDLQTSVNVLALRLGFPTVEAARTNPSARDEDVPEAVQAEFVENNPLAYAIYHYALRIYGVKEPTAHEPASSATEESPTRPC
jgi:hypothetical protein